MENQTQRCNNCGTSYRRGARFCKNCGNALPGNPLAQMQKKASSLHVNPAQLSQMASILQAKPWQVVVGEKIPTNTVQQILQVGVQAAARELGNAASAKQANRKGKSLLGPAVQAFAATLLEVLTSALTGIISPISAITKIGLSLVNLVAGAISGERRGLASIIMFLAAAGLALLQGGSLLDLLVKLVSDPSMFGQLLPGGLTQGLSFLVAVHTAVKTLLK